MKTTKLKSLIMVLLTTIISLGAFAQNIPFDINGLNIDAEKYTKAQVVAKFGEPLSYSRYADDGDGTGISERYQYRNSEFRFENNGQLVTIIVGDPQFKFMGGQIKVGDPITNLHTIPNCRFALKSHYEPENPNRSELWIGEMEWSVSIWHKNGLITKFSYSTPL